MDFEIGASAHAMSKNSTLEECISVLDDAGFKVVDFWLWRYSDSDDAPLSQENWQKWVLDVRRMLERRGMRAGQAHALWDHPNQVREDFTFDLPGSVFHRSIEATAMLGCRRLIFHPIQRWVRMTDESMRLPVLEANVEWFGALLPTAKACNVEIHLENLFCYKHLQLPEDPDFPFCSARDIRFVLDKLEHPLFRACLDTGHANLSGQNIPEMIGILGEKLGSLHLHDNYGTIKPIYDDLHLFPGYGRLPWAEIFAALYRAGYQGTLNLEPNGELPKLGHDLRVIQLRAGKECLAQFARQYMH